MKPLSTKDQKIKTSYKLKQTSKIFEQQSSQQLKHNMPPILQVLDINMHMGHIAFLSTSSKK